MELGNLKLFVVRFFCYLPGTNISSPFQGTFESMILLSRLVGYGCVPLEGSVFVSFCYKQAVEVGCFSLWVLVFEKISPLQLSDVVFLCVCVCARVFLLLFPLFLFVWGNNVFFLQMGIWRFRKIRWLIWLPTWTMQEKIVGMEWLMKCNMMDGCSIAIIRG